MTLSQSEENYLKAIYHLSRSRPASTKDLAQHLETKASSITDMLKKLAQKKLVEYRKYQGAKLTKSGRKKAIHTIRKHRLWEVFLVEKLDFKWDEVHEIAEQLEHIHSPPLVERLDAFLDYPHIDPHGDPIPDKDGNFKLKDYNCLFEADPGDKLKIVGVSDTSKAFLKFLENKDLVLGTEVELIEKEEYDGSLVIKLNGKSMTLSKKMSENILVK